MAIGRHDRGASPVKGARSSPIPLAVSAFPIPNASTRWGGSNFRDSPVGNQPKFHFPQFDGDNPRLWLSRAEDYLELYAADVSMWEKLAMMHFSAAATRWLSSAEKKLKNSSWAKFSKLVLDFFLGKTIKSGSCFNFHQADWVRGRIHREIRRAS